MNPKLVIKLLTLAVFGAVFGQLIQADYVKWHNLGRDAFLSFQGHRFDLYMANPGTRLKNLIGGAVLTVGVGALYELVALGGAKLAGLLFREKPRTEVN
jgi:hypothetical protein